MIQQYTLQEYTLQEIQQMITERSNPATIYNDQLLAYYYNTRVDKSRVIPEETLKRLCKDLKQYAKLEDKMHQPL